jgi:hypothetical protein
MGLLGRELRGIRWQRVTAELASELLTLAEKHTKASVPLMIAHRSTGISLLQYSRRWLPASK